MKRIVTAILVIALFSLCVLPCQAVSIDNDTQGDFIYVEYGEFISNREYYDALVLQGYGVCVHVGDEYSDAEIEKLMKPTDIIHVLTSSGLERGTSLPTADVNVHTGVPYSFTCNANYEMLYTNYRIYGCTTYCIDGFNEDYNNSLRVRVYGTKSGTFDLSVPPRSFLLKVVSTETESTRFFVGFYPPSHAYGEIYCVGH